MQVALIPPICQLHRTAGIPLQMVVPAGFKSSVYRSYYKMLGYDSEYILYLDNGAFELDEQPETYDHLRLVEWAHEYKVQGIVAPDYMRDTAKSFALTTEFLHTLEMQMQEQTWPSVLVPLQGKTTEELQQSFRNLQSLEEDFKRQFTVAIPRWTTEEIQPEIRMDLVQYIDDTDPHPVHLLGMSRKWPKELYYAAKYCPSVISMDTSAPFVMAAANKLLGVDGLVERPADYFDMSPVFFPNELVTRNISILQRWADGADD